MPSTDLPMTPSVPIVSPYHRYRTAVVYELAASTQIVFEIQAQSDTSDVVMGDSVASQTSCD